MLPKAALPEDLRQSFSKKDRKSGGVPFRLPA